MRFTKQAGRLAAWLEVAAMPAVTGVAVGASSGLSMGGLTGGLVMAGLSLAGLATGVVLAERDRRQSRQQAEFWAAAFLRAARVVAGLLIKSGSRKPNYLKMRN